MDDLACSILSKIQGLFDEAIKDGDAMMFAYALDEAMSFGGAEADNMRFEALSVVDPAFLRAIWEAVAARWDPGARALGWWIDQDEYAEIWVQVWDAVAEAAYGVLHPPVLPPVGAPVP